MTVTPALPRNPQTLPLWSDSPPNHKSSSSEETIAQAHGTHQIAKVQTPTIEARLPSPAHATGQAMVICPGGGYGVLAYDWEGTDIANVLNAQGIAAIVLKYRLPEKESNKDPHRSPLLDAKRALRLVRYHAKGWSIEPDKVGIIGFSAGGHLASTLGTRFDAGEPAAADPVERLSSRPDCLALIYPVISMQDPAAHSGSRKNLLGDSPPQALVDYYSSEKQVTSDTPPTFLVHSSDDEVVPAQNSLLFYQALLAKNISAEMHLYPYGGHGYSIALGKGRLSDWPNRLTAWLAQSL